MSDDKVVSIRKEEKDEMVYLCATTEEGEPCETTTFLIHEYDYECTNCHRRVTFEEVHGSID